MLITLSVSLQAEKHKYYYVNLIFGREPVKPQQHFSMEVVLGVCVDL